MPKNSIGSNAIRNAVVTGTKLASSAVTGTAVADGSLGPADLSPSALGDHSLGRTATTANQACDPPATTACASVTLSIPAPARVLVAADGVTVADLGGDGKCQLTVDGSAMSSGTGDLFTQLPDSFTLDYVSGVLGAGSHTLAMSCSEVTPDFKVDNTHISAVSLSAN